MTTLTMIQQYMYLIIAVVCLAIGSFAFYKIRQTIGYKHFKYRLQRKYYVDTVKLYKGGGYEFDVLPLTTQGKEEFLQGKSDQYGYAPIANGLAIIEDGNAIPVVRGGYVPVEVEKEARAQEKVDADSTEESDIAKIFKWTINANKLQTTLIRPITRWSSRELDGAIKSKVIEELLDIPLKLIDIAILIFVFVTLAVTAYFGYQNNTVLQQILTEVSELPYQPIP